MLQTEKFLFRKCISRLKVTEIFEVLSSWPFLGPENVESLRSDVDTKRSKQITANVILEFCQNKGGLNLEKIGELELLCIQHHAAKRQWTAYRLSGKQGKVPADISSPVKFKQRLNKFIRLYFNKDCITSVLLHHGLLWTRVYLPKPGTKVYQANRCLYFVHYPDTPVVIFSGMRAGFADFLTHCLVVALGYQEITEMCLSGHHIESIAELAINKFSEGGFIKFQKTHRPNGPLGLTTTRKRKVPDTSFDSSIVDEKRVEKRQRLEMLANSFGDFEQPQLEKIEFKVELPYRSKTIAQDLRSEGHIFQSRVKFQGKNVLEGLRNLGERGYARVPLPKHLTCVPSRARNYFLLAKAPRKNDTIQEKDKSLSQDTSPAQKEMSSPREARALRRSVLSKENRQSNNTSRTKQKSR